MDEYLKQVKEIAYGESKRTGTPYKKQIDLGVKKALNLAERLGADPFVVQIGVLMADCMLGQAIKDDCVGDHVQMSLERTEEWLNTTDIEDKDKENILHCVSEHHGMEKFFSKESEICCNADCYKFASVEGFLCSVRYTREMPFKDLIILLNNKVEEKWNALTLDICKEELEQEYRLIKELLKYLK